MRKTMRRRRRNKERKTRRNKKGGFMNEWKLKLPGLPEFGERNGAKVYRDGEFKEQKCYNLGGFRFCDKV